MDEMAPTPEAPELGSQESELLGTLAELRGFVLDNERRTLGDPIRREVADKPVDKLHAASGRALEEADEEVELRHLYGLRVQVACLTLSGLSDEAIDQLAESSGLDRDELAEARARAAAALANDSESRRQAARALFEELGTSADGEDVELHDLLGHMQKLGHWPGDPSSPLVEAYRSELADAVERHGRFALWAAARLVRRRPSPLLVAVSLVGIREALERFDPYRGNQLTTYAMHWVRSKVQRALAKHGADVRVPVPVGNRRSRLRRVTLELLAEHGALPSIEELAHTGEVGSRGAVEKLVEMGWLRLWDAWFTLTPDGLAPAEQVLDETVVPPGRERLRSVLDEMLREALDGLPDRQRDIIQRRFGLNDSAETLMEIGSSYDVSRERIRQLETKALDTLAFRHAEEVAELTQDLAPVP